MADEKKRIIDLSELSQEVQVGQYILVDSASGTGKMNLKKIVDDSTTSLAERVTDLETGLTEEENARIAADTELSGNVSNLQTVLETKADNNGYYPDLYAGNLSSTRKQTDSIPYIMRKTGGDLSRIGEREDDTLVGATVNVNQLVDTDTSSVTIQSGHKYYAKISGTESIGASTGTAISVTGGTDMVTDLTAYFGSTIADYLYSLETATAGAGVAKLREWGVLTNEYIPYNTGSLESVEATAHKMVGFNQFDFSRFATEYPQYCTMSNGVLRVNAGSVLFNTGIAVDIPAGAYLTAEVRVESAVNIRIRLIYENGAVQEVTFGSPSDFTKYGASLQNKRLVAIRLNWSTSGVFYIRNFCINLSSDRNGEYEPYSAHTYDLGTDTLRGLFKLDSENRLYADGDTKTSDGTVTRKYGVVDLGEQTWYDNSSAAFFYAYLSGYKDNARGSNIVAPNAICTRYIAGTVRGVTLENADKTFSLGTTSNYSGRILIKDTAYTDAAAFKTAMSGVILVYELATPTTEQSTPFQNPQICDPDGTEEYVTSNGVPVGHATEYDYDIKGLAEELIDVPDVPSTNGTYVLKATRTADGLAYSWVAG